MRKEMVALGNKVEIYIFFVCAQSYKEEVQEPEILGEMEEGIAEVYRKQMTLPSHSVTKYLHILGGTASLL